MIGPSTQRARARRLLHAGPLTTLEVAALLDIAPASAANRLRELERAGRVVGRTTANVREWALPGRLSPVGVLGVGSWLGGVQ